MVIHCFLFFWLAFPHIFQLSVRFLLEMFLSWRTLQLLKIPTLPLSMFPDFLQLCLNQSYHLVIVRSTISSGFSFTVPYPIPKPFVYQNVIYLVLRPSIRRQPCIQCIYFSLKPCIGNHEIVSTTAVHQKLSMPFSLANPKRSNNAFVFSVTNFSI